MPFLRPCDTCGAKAVVSVNQETACLAHLDDVMSKVGKAVETLRGLVAEPEGGRGKHDG